MKDEKWYWILSVCVNNFTYPLALKYAPVINCMSFPISRQKAMVIKIVAQLWPPNNHWH